MWDKLIYGVRKLTEVGITLIAFGVVLQVLFGDKLIGFYELDVVANIIAIVNPNWKPGLVGLVVLIFIGPY